MTILPRTKNGKWSVGLIVIMPILIALGGVLANSMYASVEAGDGLIDDLANRPTLAVSALTGIVAGIAGFLTGLIAIWKKQERALLVYLSTFFGALLVLFIIADLVFPQD